MTTAIVLFNRDLRVHDHPALAAAVREAETVVPLFVFDERLLASDGASPNRVTFLVDSLRALREELRARGGDLVVRRGDPVAEAVALAREVGADAIFASADVSQFARRRERKLAEAAAAAGVALRLTPGVTVVETGALQTSSGGFYRVFTPYWRAWGAARWRAIEEAPERIELPRGVAPAQIPDAIELLPGERSPELPIGGEAAGREVLEQFAREGVAQYEDARDVLAEAGTTLLSPYLHFGCVSPLEVATELGGRAGGEAVVRQLCWRDYYHQLAYHFPAIGTEDFRPRDRRWSDDGDALEAWREGRTGYPIIDAAMRQLRQRGWMHNRARLLVGSFLTKHLGIDWREGAAHFSRWLVDGDLASNARNWQWVAGTGTDTRPNRILNPIRQAKRFDPDGDYVRRFVPELAALEGREIHEPWRLGAARLEELGYPERIIDHELSAQAFLDEVHARRAGGG